jgi:hypothetical protein
MNRREFITLLGGAAAWPLTARGQQPGRTRQITVWMGRGNDAEGLRNGSAFRQGLQALGWTDGRNVRIDYRWVETLAGHQRLRAERSTSAFWPIWLRIGSSMGARCSSGFGGRARRAT